MRLGQFSRKFDLSIPNIIAFLSDHPDFQESSFHPNIRLEEEIENKILSHFGVELPTEKNEPEPTQTEAPVSEKIEPLEDENQNKQDAQSPLDKEKQELTPAEEIAAVDGELEMETPVSEEEKLVEDSTDEDTEEEKSKDDDEVKRSSEEKSISSDQLLQMLESDDSPNLEDIRLIKAPKRELAGLKVLGKVEIAEPKKRESKSEKASREEAERQQKKQISEEEKERRRLKAKRKKEALQAKRERIQKQKEAKRLKEIKEQHYREKLESQHALPNRKKKPTVEKPASKPTKTTKQEAPKSLLGRFWRWMNT